MEEKWHDVTAITVKEIKSILFAVYYFNMSESNLRKPDYVTRLMAEMEKDISKYTRFLPKDQNEVEPNNNAQSNKMTRVYIYNFILTL